MVLFGAALAWWLLRVYRPGSKIRAKITAVKTPNKSLDFKTEKSTLETTLFKTEYSGVLIAPRLIQYGFCFTFADVL